MANLPGLTTPNEVRLAFYMQLGEHGSVCPSAPWKNNRLKEFVTCGYKHERFLFLLLRYFPSIIGTILFYLVCADSIRHMEYMNKRSLIVGAILC